MNDGPTSVYTYYDACGHILYIGVTGRGVKRGQEHARTKEWWPLVDHSTVKHFDTRERALAEEAYQIRYHRPPYNTVGKPTGGPRWRPHTHHVSVDTHRTLFGRLSRPKTLADIRLDLIRAQYEAARAKGLTVAEFREELRTCLVVKSEAFAAA